VVKLDIKKVKQLTIWDGLSTFVAAPMPGLRSSHVFSSVPSSDIFSSFEKIRYSPFQIVGFTTLGLFGTALLVRPCLVSKKICKIFQILRYIKSLDVCMEY